MSLLPIYIFFSFTIIFAFFVIVLKSAFTSGVAAGLFSSSCAILYFFLNSPDVSMTEVSIGVFLSTAIYVMTLRITRVETFEPQKKVKLLISILFFIILSFVFYSAVKTLGEFGAMQGTVNGSGSLYLLSSYRDYQIPNTVTTILASYRGFDTMGEVTIIFTAAFSVFLILGLKNSKFNSL